MARVSGETPFYGVDGCPGGWLLVGLDETGGGAPEIAATFEEVAARTAGARLVLVDIPIGLPARGRRECDLAAAKALSRAASSVFPVPVREAVYARGYREACAVQERLTGRRLSRQSWALVPKIQEVDEVVRRVPALGQRIRESHPELCFAALNGGRPLARSKRDALGVLERAALLEPHLGDVRALLRRALEGVPARGETEENRRAKGRRTARARGGGSRAEGHDVLDAAVLAVCARLAARHGLLSLPAGRVEKDSEGLRMEIVLARVPGEEPDD